MEFYATMEYIFGFICLINKQRSFVMRRIRLSLAYASVFLLLMISVQGFAQQSASIAVFDFMKTIETSKAGQAAASQLKVKEEEIAGELGNIEKQILSFQQKLTRQRLTMNPSAQQDLAKKIEDLQVEKKRRGEDLSKEYQNLQYNLIEKMKREILTVVHQIAREKSFSLVFELSSGGIAYFEENFDITADVIRRYDASKAGR